jgi:hypothetical protein
MPQGGTTSSWSPRRVLLPVPNGEPILELFFEKADETGDTLRAKILKVLANDRWSMVGLFRVASQGG